MKALPYSDCRFQPIYLNNGEQAFVSSEDYEKISSYNWFQNGQGYAATGHDSILMHHLVLGHHDCTKTEIHHINGNKLDNCRWNLKVLRFSEHLVTRPKQANNKSGYKGVCWKPGQGNRKSRWVAQISANNQKIHIGYFDSEVKAAAAYDKKAKELYGDIAYLNFPYGNFGPQ